MIISHDGINVLIRKALNSSEISYYSGQVESLHRLHSGYISPYTYYFKTRIGATGMVIYNNIGDTVLTRIYNDTFLYNEGTENITVCADSSFLMVGETDSLNSRMTWAFIRRVNQTGQAIWMKRFNIDTTANNRFTSVESLPNHNILVGGMLLGTTIIQNFRFHFKRPWFLLLDSSGNKLKDTLYSVEYVGGGNIFSDINGGYFHFGYRDSMPRLYPHGITSSGNWPAYIAHLDTNFKMTWRLPIMHYPEYFTDIWQVKQLKDSAYLIIGEHIDTFAHFRGYLAKVSKTGVLRWEHYYYKDSTVPGYLVDGEERVSGGYVAVGWTKGCPTCSQDVWVVSVDSNGCELPGCSNGLAVSHVPPIEPAFALYPNPTSGALTVNLASAGMLEMYNLQGQIVAKYTIKAQSQPLRLPASLSAGMYYGRFVSVKGEMVVVKINYEP